MPGEIETNNAMWTGEKITNTKSDISWKNNSSDASTESDDNIKKIKSTSSSNEDLKYENLLSSSEGSVDSISRLEWTALGHSPSPHKVLDLFRLDVENEVIEDAHCGPSLTNRALAEPVMSENYTVKSGELSGCVSIVNAMPSVKHHVDMCSARTCPYYTVADVNAPMGIPARPVLGGPSALPPPSPPPSPPPHPRLQQSVITSPYSRVMGRIESERPATVVPVLQQHEPTNNKADICLGSSYDIFRMDLEDNMSDSEFQSLTPMRLLASYTHSSIDSSFFPTPSYSEQDPHIRLAANSQPQSPLPLELTTPVSSEDTSLKGTMNNALVETPPRRPCEVAGCDARHRLDKKYKEIMGIMAGLQDLMATKAKAEERGHTEHPESSVDAAIAICKADTMVPRVQPRSGRSRGRGLSQWLVQGRFMLWCAWAAWVTLVLQAAGLLDMLGVDDAAVKTLPVISLSEILAMLEVLGLLEVLWLLKGMPVNYRTFDRPEFYVDAATNTD